jgi:regulator of protease activity HflC (stomatin/prohibitin superfamily)
MDPKTKDLQGEGNYDAAHPYNEELAKSVAKGQAKALAEKAKKALAGPEGEALRSADEQGKNAATPKPTT